MENQEHVHPLSPWGDFICSTCQPVEYARIQNELQASAQLVAERDADIMEEGRWESQSPFPSDEEG